MRAAARMWPPGPVRDTRAISLDASAWDELRAEETARAERIRMPSLAEPIHPRACDCAACRHVYGPRM